VKNYRYDSFAIIPPHLDHLVSVRNQRTLTSTTTSTLLFVKGCPSRHGVLVQVYVIKLIKSKVTLCFAWCSYCTRKKKDCQMLKCARRASLKVSGLPVIGRRLFLLPPSRVALWVDGSCLSCDFDLTSQFLRNFGPFATASCSDILKGLEKWKGSRCWRLLCSSFAWVLLWVSTFLSGTVLCRVFLH